jgi:prepilin-type N-terminal cleavage/methylation domain-containing protein
MSDRMKKKMPIPGMRGMSLIEVLVAIAILSVAMVSITSAISVGLLQLNSIRIQRSASNCARLVMEYINTMPPDVIYGLSPGAPIFGNFATSGLMSLNDFANSGTNNACKELSDPTSAVGQKVDLQYGICPGCTSTTITDATTLVSYTTCIFLIRVRTEYSSPSVGGRRTINFFVKKQTGMYDNNCENTCGTGTPTGSLRDCAW